MVYGFSTGIESDGTTDPTTEATVAAHDAAIKAIVDSLAHHRRRLASLQDNAVEPDDLRTEDEMTNLEREA